MLPLIKLLIVIAIFVFLIVRKWEIGITMLICSFLLGLLFTMHPFIILKECALAIIDAKTITLVATIFLTYMLGNCLKEFGYLRNLTLSLRNLIRDRRLTLVIPPAIIGFIPMPAGAMLSAPMINEIGQKMNLASEIKTFINHWFRHLWEYSWPIYPGIILAASILSVPIRSLVLNQYPLTLAMIAAGFIFGFTKLPRVTETEERRQYGQGFKLFLLSIWPVVLVFVLVLVFKLDIIVALLITLLCLILTQKLNLGNLWSILKRSFSWQVILLLVSVMIFKRILEVSGALSLNFVFLKSGKLFFLIPVAFIPFLVGFLTGVTPATVGITFPILLPLLGGNLTYVMFAYACGFAGVLLSPVHLCLVVTKEYFKADFAKVYKLLIPPTLFVIAVALLILLLKT